MAEADEKPIEAIIKEAIRANRENFKALCEKFNATAPDGSCSAEDLYGAIINNRRENFNTLMRDTVSALKEAGITDHTKIAEIINNEMGLSLTPENIGQYDPIPFRELPTGGPIGPGTGGLY